MNAAGSLFDNTTPVPIREYVCPYCQKSYLRVDPGRIHPEWETLSCFDCAKQGVQRRPPITGEEYRAYCEAMRPPVKARPITAKGRRWGRRNGGTTWYAGEGERSRL